MDFLERAKTQGFVREELDAEMIVGAMLDRAVNQVQFAPWIKKTFDADVFEDAEYKRRWCAANIDLFLNGIAP